MVKSVHTISTRLPRSGLLSRNGLLWLQGSSFLLEQQTASWRQPPPLGHLVAVVVNQSFLYHFQIFRRRSFFNAALLATLAHSGSAPSSDPTSCSCLILSWYRTPVSPAPTDLFRLLGAAPAWLVGQASGLLDLHSAVPRMDWLAFFSRGAHQDGNAAESCRS